MVDHDLEEILARSRPSLAMLRRLLPFVRRHWAVAVPPLVIEFVFVLSWAVGPHLIKLTIDEFIPAKLMAGVFCVAGLMVLNGAFQAALSAYQRICVWTASQHILNDLRKRLFAHIQQLSMEFFDREKQGRVIARVDRDVEALEDILARFPLLVIHTIASAVVVGGVLLSYDWRLFLVVAAAAPVVAAAAWALNKWGMPAYRKVRRSVSRMTAHLAENVSGVQVVQAFGREEHNLGFFQTILDEFKGHVMLGATVRGITFPSMMLVLALVNAGVIAYAGYAVPRGHMTIGKVPATIMYIGMIYGPIMMLALMYDQMLGASAAAERVFQLMDRRATITDHPGVTDIPTIEGRVAFDRVFFKYDDEPASPWTLEDVSFEAKPGDIFALVGPTGAGKTSIVNLIPRFYQPQQGRITIDGIDIRDVTQESLHKQMGIVLQENFLFAGTVMDNLKYARPDATDEEAVAAARALGSHDVIEGLADGYATDVRERGGAISHGERQLICFTRALIADPRILILDEATSAVDTDTELVIQSALARLMEGRTTFVVAHRLSTVRHADRILVIENGRIVESGAHAELVALGRTYADMFEEFIRQV